MITSVAWIPRGAARERPVKFEASAEELARVRELAKQEAEVEAELEAEATRERLESNDSYENGDDDLTTSIDLPSELQMNSYNKDAGDVFGEPSIDVTDPYEQYELVEIGGRVFGVEADSEEDEDAEDDRVKPTDALLLVTLTEDDYSHLEVQVFTDEGGLFVHHDITLPEFPICLAWCDCPPYLVDGKQTSVGNFVAVGTFDPAIEIWNLDVLDPLEPSAVLGGVGTNNSLESSKKKKKKLKPKLKPDSHEEAVMALSWNSTYRQVMASGSADTTVKIWDITTQICSHTFTHHSGKVQSVQFHGREPWLLATGSFDRTVALVDCRAGSVSARYSVTSDLEAMAWNPFNSYELFASLEDGSVSCLDLRRGDRALYSFQAHDKTTSSLSFSAMIPGMLATASVDKTVKVWDVSGAGEARPALVAYKNLAVGKLFTLQFYPSSPFLLAAGGDKGLVSIWESDETKEIQERFEARIVDRDRALAPEFLLESTVISQSYSQVRGEDSVTVDVVVDEVHEDMDVETSSSAPLKKKKASKKNKKLR